MFLHNFLNENSIHELLKENSFQERWKKKKKQTSGEKNVYCMKYLFLKQ